MAASPTVSVLMTAYNVAPYIGAAIESALAQTFRDFELIVLDDGSMDGTLGIVDRFSDPRVRVVRSAHRGAAAQLCVGLQLARGRYVALLDGDDVWASQKLEQHVQFLDAQPRADLSFSWSRIIDEDGQDTGLTSRLWNGPISFSELLCDNAAGNGSALVLRREVLMAAGGIDPSFAVYYDLDAWLRIGAVRPGNLWAIPQFLTFSRRRPGQLSADVPLVEQSFEQLMQRARWFAPRAVAVVEDRARSNMQRFYAYSWYRAGSYGRALGVMIRSLRRAPRMFFSDRRNWEMAAAALSASVLPVKLHRRITSAALLARRA